MEEIPVRIIKDDTISLKIEDFELPVTWQFSGDGTNFSTIPGGNETSEVFNYVVHSPGFIRAYYDAGECGRIYSDTSYIYVEERYRLAFYTKARYNESLNIYEDYDGYTDHVENNGTFVARNGQRQFFKLYDKLDEVFVPFSIDEDLYGNSDTKYTTYGALFTSEDQFIVKNYTISTSSGERIIHIDFGFTIQVTNEIFRQIANKTYFVTYDYGMDGSFEDYGSFILNDDTSMELYAPSGELVCTSNFRLAASPEGDLVSLGCGFGIYGEYAYVVGGKLVAASDFVKIN
jgi:hypothetical protein